MRSSTLTLVLIASACAIAACSPATKVTALTSENPAGAQTGCLTSMDEPSRPQGKTEWPELVGQDAGEAKSQIEKDGFHVVLVKLGSVMTMDFRQNRVRIMHDTDNKVVKPPRIG